MERLPVHQKLAMHIAHKKAMEITIARLKQICYVSDHPNKFSPELVSFALASHEDYALWDKLWDEEMKRVNQSAKTFLDGVWENVSNDK